MSADTTPTLPTLLQKLVLKLDTARSQDIIRNITPFLRPGSTILDIGSGVGVVARKLMHEDFQVRCLDVVNRSAFPETTPIIYDGHTFPFANRSFDTGLMITVLHHLPHQVELLTEAARVCRHLIVMEDVVTSKPQTYATYAMDSLINLEFFGHPHTNRTYENWQALCKKLGFKILDSTHRPYWLVFRSATFHLQSPANRSST